MRALHHGVEGEDWMEMKPLPDWVMQGAIACIRGRSNKVQQILEQLIRHETPLAAVWLPDWSGQRQQQITSKVA
ncbi:hypothetical protein VTP01DRAFT_1442 [Rhizomucor pusillus]|uniref:uncharacterized protein n=1 Tax=Rhizomucor pusillus TaxID=4840 RepID=UPI003744205F